MELPYLFTRDLGIFFYFSLLPAVNTPLILIDDSMLSQDSNGIWQVL